MAVAQRQIAKINPTWGWGPFMPQAILQWLWIFPAQTNTMTYISCRSHSVSALRQWPDAEWGQRSGHSWGGRPQQGWQSPTQQEPAGPRGAARSPGSPRSHETSRAYVLSLITAANGPVIYTALQSGSAHCHSALDHRFRCSHLLWFIRWHSLNCSSVFRSRQLQVIMFLLNMLKDMLSMYYSDISARWIMCIVSSSLEVVSEWRDHLTLNKRRYLFQ